MTTATATGVNAHTYFPSGEAKTICTSHVLAAFGIDASTYHYSGRTSQRAAILRRNGFAVRSRMSWLKSRTVGSARSVIRGLAGSYDPTGTRYMLCLVGDGYAHAILLDATGATIVDTDPREADRRRVVAIHAVFKSPS